LLIVTSKAREVKKAIAPIIFPLGQHQALCKKLKIKKKIKNLNYIESEKSHCVASYLLIVIL